MSTDRSTGLLGRYEQFLWGMMDAFGVTQSIERKVLTATGLQFAAILAIFVLGVLLLGTQTFRSMFSALELSAFGAVFVLAIAALVNTILILKRDFIEPIQEMQAVAKSVAAGELDRSVPETDQTDEIGSLVHSFEDMHDYLLTVSAQAAALSREEFDADVLDESVPGSFGTALSRMEHNLEERIDDLESQRETIEARNEKLTDTAEDYTRTISRVADGDLTERLEDSVDDQAMQEVATAFNEMVDEWEAMIGDLLAFSRQVAAESTQVQTNADEVRDASEDISESVQEISAGVDEESRRLDTASGEAENLSATIEEITASADNVATLTDETAEIGSEGRDAAGAAETEMDALEDQSEEVSDAVETLSDTIEEISEITDVILDIAEQTNILALNAGIEAARAESGGDGFAVVAEEVKSLAEETKESAEDIEALIDDVQTESERTVEEIGDMRDRVESSAETVETATDAFERMAENVAEINTSIKEVNDATAEQAESMQDVVAMIEEIATISDQTANEAETVAAAAQEQSATLNQVAENTDDLAANANDLEASLAEFTVRENREGSDVTDRKSPTEPRMSTEIGSIDEHAGNGDSGGAATIQQADGGERRSGSPGAGEPSMEWEAVGNGEEE
ncbi:MAG: methyl-accepting chemotaxis protein [Halodesulfurarchaeum sp.]